MSAFERPSRSPSYAAPFHRTYGFSYCCVMERPPVTACLLQTHVRSNARILIPVLFAIDCRNTGWRGQQHRRRKRNEIRRKGRHMGLYTKANPCFRGGHRQHGSLDTTRNATPYQIPREQRLPNPARTESASAFCPTLLRAFQVRRTSCIGLDSVSRT